MLNLSLDMEKVLPPPIVEVGEASGELDIASGGCTDSCIHREKAGFEISEAAKVV